MHRKQHKDMSHCEAVQFCDILTLNLVRDIC